MTNLFSASSLSMRFHSLLTRASCSCSNVFSRSIFSRLSWGTKRWRARMTSDRAWHKRLRKSLSALTQGTANAKVSVMFSDMAAVLQSPQRTLSKHYELVTGFQRALKGKHLNNKKGFCLEHQAFNTEVKLALIPLCLDMHNVILIHRNFWAQFSAKCMSITHCTAIIKPNIGFLISQVFKMKT